VAYTLDADLYICTVPTSRHSAIKRRRVAALQNRASLYLMKLKKVNWVLTVQGEQRPLEQYNKIVNSKRLLPNYLFPLLIELPDTAAIAAQGANRGLN
jgi:hypothetical protein